MSSSPTGPQPHHDRVVDLQSEPVELYKVLKFEGMAESGGQAKAVVAGGLVLVNGEVELQKRKKVRAGDIIEFNGESVLLQLQPPLQPPGSAEAEQA